MLGNHGVRADGAKTAICRMLEPRRDCENYPKAFLTARIRKLLVILNAMVRTILTGMVTPSSALSPTLSPEVAGSEHAAANPLDPQ